MKKYFSWIFIAALALPFVSAFAGDSAEGSDEIVILPIEEDEGAVAASDESAE